jgi:hypothetical protein
MLGFFGETLIRRAGHYCGVGGSITGRAVAILLAALTAAQGLPAASPETPPASGEWQIFGPVVLENGTFHINGTVYVWGNGSLTVRNATLVFDRYCNVLAEGPLVMTGSSVHPAPGVSQGAIEVRYGTGDFRLCAFDNISFAVRYGEARFTGCNFSGWNSGIYQETYGAPAYGLQVDNCTFVDAGNGCIRTQRGGVLVQGCRFFYRAADAADSGATQYADMPSQPGARVLDNLFLGLSIGIDIASSNYYTPMAVELYCNDQVPQLIRGNVFSGFSTGVKVESYDSSVEVGGNRLVGCGLAIDASATYANVDCIVSNNTIEGGQNGIEVYSHSIDIVNNSISNCTGNGFYWDDTTMGGPGPSIRDNRVAGCRFGAYFLNLGPEFRDNTVSDCSVAGIY